MALDNLSLGYGGTSRFSGQRGRTADGMSRSGVRYPSPFFDIGHTYLPPTTKALLRWCRYYYLTNPLINSVIHKMSEYPITEIVIDERDANRKEMWETILGKHLRYRPFQIETGLDYYTYGICIVTIHFPFTKWLICRNCKHKEKASNLHYKWRELNYVIQCEKCGHHGPAIVEDFSEKSVRRIRLQRWNPEYVHIDPGFAGNDPVYTFEIPLQLRNDILMGKKSVLDTIPDVFIEAMRRNKFIRFADDNVFVLKRPIIAQKDDGWGMPLIFPVLKDTFYLQILRKAQEAIAQEHIVPLRIMFPQAGSASSDPYTTINLDSWRSKVEGELAKWKYDPNYIPVMPLPVGNQTFGGDGKALILHQEMDSWSRQIVAGMGVPQEFIFGGMQYSGSNVSMRMLENMFMAYRVDHENMLNDFVIRRISNFMGWTPVRAHMRRFKMADDLQRMSLIVQLNQAQKISDQTMLQEVDQDPVVEAERKNLELDKQMSYQRKMQIAQAHMQAEAQAIQMKAQMQAQQAAQPPPGPDPNAAMQQQPGSPPQDPNAAQQGQPPQQDPNAAMGGQPPPPAQGGPTTGQEGEMMPGQQVDPAMPEGSTVSMENAQQAPQEGIPQEMQGPMTMGMEGGGANMLYLAKRAAQSLSQMDDMTRTIQLTKMKSLNPQLYMLVMQILKSGPATPGIAGSGGSQADPLNAAQSPLPQLRPTRRVAPVGV